MFDLINKILSDYEKSIFDGVISDDKILRAIYTENGREYQELLYYEPIPSKEERELGLTKEGIEKLFYFIGIPDYSMYPIIADIITRFQEKNYRDGREIDERYARIFNKKFNLDGKYYVGDLEFNNTLSTHVVLDTNAFRYSSLEESRYLYPTGNNKLILDSLPIYKIVNRYVEQELDASLADNINKQNNVVSNVMTLLTRLTPGGSNSEIDYSEYYWDLFKYLDRYPIKNYFLNERAIESNSAKKELEDVRDSLSKLQDLTKEETELLSRLA